MLPCTGEISCSLDQGWHLLNNKAAFKERLLQYNVDWGHKPACAAILQVLLDQVASIITWYRAAWTRLPNRIQFWNNCWSVFLSCIDSFVISCYIKVSLQRFYRSFSSRLERTSELFKATQQTISKRVLSLSVEFPDKHDFAITTLSGALSPAELSGIIHSKHIFGWSIQGKLFPVLPSNFRKLKKRQSRYMYSSTWQGEVLKGRLDSCVPWDEGAMEPTSQLLLKTVETSTF